MHIVKIDLTAPGIGFAVTAPGGTLETVRQTTLAFLNQEHAQLAINSHFFLPFPSFESNSMLVGLAASHGNVYSSFETPVQSCCIVANAPALNIDALNHASIVHYNPNFADGRHVLENVNLWNTVSGSAQIITDGKKTIPVYRDASHPDGLLTPGGPDSSSNSDSWYALKNSRTVIGLSQDNRTLFLFTVDKAGGSLGMSLEEVADLLISEYGVHNALNLDGGGSTTLAMQDPATGAGAIINVSSDNPNGRSVASNLAVFALPAPEPASAGVVPPSSR
jgi:exopolysaccharide biosynthesis protein